MTDSTKPVTMRTPFPPHQISKLPKPYKKDSPKGNCSECGGFHGLPAVHLDYVGHAALTDRMLDVDPGWTWEPLSVDEDGLPRFDKTGGLWIRLTVSGVTRLGYGHAEGKVYMDIGAREKEVIGDALRNAAMRFGAALDLWHKGDLHGDDEEPENTPDKYPKPTTGARENVGEDRSSQLAIIADEIASLMNSGDEDGALSTFETLTDNEEIIAMWTFLNASGHRSRLKDLQKQKRERSGK